MMGGREEAWEGGGRNHFLKSWWGSRRHTDMDRGSWIEKPHVSVSALSFAGCVAWGFSPPHPFGDLLSLGLFPGL